MSSLADLQTAIAAHITELPPQMQANVLKAVELAYKAGFIACQQEMQQATKSLTVH